MAIRLVCVYGWDVVLFWIWGCYFWISWCGFVLDVSGVCIAVDWLGVWHRFCLIVVTGFRFGLC